MPIYKYRAVSATGENITGTYNAKVKDEVINMLRENKYFPVDVNEVIEGKDISLSIFKGVNTRDLAVFCRQFYAMLNAGVPIINCLDILRIQTENKKLQKVIGEVYEEVQKGLSFSESMRNHQDVFPDLLINMIEAGEVSGKLDVIMDRMAVNYEKENRINGKIKGAMVYPIILSVISVCVVVFLLVFVMPSFMEMFEGSGTELPGPTKVLLSVSNGLQKYWYIILLAIVVGFFGIKQALKNEDAKIWFDNLKLTMPIISVTMKKIITSRFTRTLSTLLSSGIPLLQALDIVSKIVGNAVVEKGIQKARDDVKKGSTLAAPIRNIGVFPPMVESMLHIGEETGALDEILEKTAVFYDDEVEVAMQKMTTLIEPLLIVLMALIVGSIVIAMIMPMFEMMNTVQ